VRNQNNRMQFRSTLFLKTLHFTTIIIVCTMSKSLCIQYFDLDTYPEIEVVATHRNMSSVFIPRLKVMLKHSINALSPSILLEEEDEIALATIVFESMYTKGRVYHSMEHVFNIIENCDVELNPMLILSVLFHDVIYFSVDKCFQQSQLEFLRGVLAFEENTDEEKDEEMELQPQQPLTLASDAQEDPINDMLVRLFGLEAGMTLPKFGTNEFLSAVVGVRALSKWLNHAQLTQLAACIEGTIPFRPPSDDGKTAMDRLYDRLVLVAPNEPEEWLVETIHFTATMANCDLCSFDSSDFDFFLDSSWSLIPEFRATILDEDCSLREYYQEFLAMEGRTKFLTMSVPNIFQAFRNIPPKKEMVAKQNKARENLNASNDYAQVRRLEYMALMELVTVIGENPDTLHGRRFLHLELPETQPYSEEHKDLVRRLLHVGRRTGYAWDPVKTSLGTFLYDRLGKKGVDTAVEVGKNETAGNYALLNHLPKDVVEAIASSLCDVLPNRSSSLLQITDNLNANENVISISNELEKVSVTSAK